MASVNQATPDADLEPRPPLTAGRLLRLVGRKAAPFGSIIVLMLIWEGFAKSGILTPFLLPSIETIFARVITDIASGQFFIKAALTLYRALAGFALAALMAITTRCADVAQVAGALVLRSDHFGRLPDAESGLPADIPALVRRLRHLEDPADCLRRVFRHRREHRRRHAGR